MDKRSRPAAIGWGLFRESGFTLTRNEVNAQLTDMGLKAIQKRTYDHYGRLVRHGFQRYITINQFDVHQLRNPVWSSALRRRYRLRPSEVEATLRLLDPDGDGDRTVTAHVSAVSDALILIKDTELTPDDENSHGVLVMGEGGELLSVVVDLVTGGGTGAELTVLGHVDVSEANDLEELPERRMTLTIDRADASSLAETARTVYQAFQLIESVRILCDAALVEIDGEDSGYDVGVPRVLGMSKSNPTMLEIAMTSPVLAMVAYLISQWNTLRQSEAGVASTYGDAEAKKAQAERIRAEGRHIDAQTEAVEERTRTHRLFNDANERAMEEITAESVYRRVIDEVRKALEVDGDETPELPAADLPAIEQGSFALDAEAQQGVGGDEDGEEPPIIKLIEDEVLPAVAEMFGFDLRSISVESDDLHSVSDGEESEGDEDGGA